MTIIILFFPFCDGPSKADMALNSRLIGSWTRMVKDDKGMEFKAELIFSENNYDIIILGEEVPGYKNMSGKYEIKDMKITLKDDNDCSAKGTYHINLTNNQLNITYEDDGCELRSVILSGVWTHKEI